MQTKLTIIITKGNADYVAYCSELGVSGRGRTVKEARASVEAAIRDCLEEFGLAIRRQDELN